MVQEVRGEQRKALKPDENSWLTDGFYGWSTFIMENRREFVWLKTKLFF